MTRKKQSQSKHDAKVRNIARDLTAKGFEVQADLKGYKKPDTINGYRPDVVAKKGKQKRIIEVETPDSVNSARDVKQQKAFRNAANRAANTTFRRTITD